MISCWGPSYRNNRSATILLNMAWPVTFATVGWQLAGYEGMCTSKKRRRLEPGRENLKGRLVALGVLKVTPGFLLSLGYASYFVVSAPCNFLSDMFKGCKC